MNKSTQRALTTSAKAAHYSYIAWTPDLESQHGDPDHPENLISYSLYHCSVTLKCSSKCAHNLLSKCWISDWAVSMEIQIAVPLRTHP